MSKSNVYENAWLLLELNNVDITLIGDAGGLRGSAVAGSVYVSLHTADPTEGGNQESSEANYTSYARVAVARSGAGWTVVGNAASNAAIVTFPECTGGDDALTHFGVGTSLSGTGKLLRSGALTSPVAVSDNITPIFAIGALVVTEE